MCKWRLQPKSNFLFIREPMKFLSPQQAHNKLHTIQSWVKKQKTKSSLFTDQMGCMVISQFFFLQLSLLLMYLVAHWVRLSTKSLSVADTFKRFSQTINRGGSLCDRLDIENLFSPFFLLSPILFLHTLILSNNMISCLHPSVRQGKSKKFF